MQLNRSALEASGYELSAEDIDALVQFAADVRRLLGPDLQTISIEGDTDSPTIAVRFRARQRPGVLYAYKWRLHDLDDPQDANPLAVQLVDYLGNAIISDRSSTPGLPIWEPDATGIVEVDVRSERYRSWRQEWLRLGRPWRDQQGRLRHADK